MTRKEYELIYQAFKNYRLYMSPEEEVLSEKILDDLFYPHFDALEGIQELDFKKVNDPELPEFPRENWVEIT
tara:strand:- start:906 stop:1121 length:216 start_codon:yes stop_codon:yes gene_type:complete